MAGKHSLGLSLRYHDYMALIVHTANESCRWNMPGHSEMNGHSGEKENFFTKPHHALLRRCRQYVDTVQRDAKHIFGSLKCP